ncbi:MAG: TlpA family protein disulfide reductase [Bacteroides sp.]|nr:TlpA family protein disulfide reductase [Bacteroides sp.]
MKKSMIALGATAMLLAACGPGDKFSLKVTVPETAVGQTVAVLNVSNGDTLGSALANDTIVTISGTVTKPTMGVIVSAGMPLNQAVIEPGNISFNKDNLAVGTKTNDAFAKYMTTTLGVIEELQKVTDDAVQDSIIDNGLVPAAVDFVKENPNNLYNQVVFQQFAPFYNAEQLRTIMANDTVVAADPNAKRILEAAENKEKTQAGNPYVDVDILQADGSTVKLSEFITPGRYTIVDFWASWCQPCRQEIPGLVEIYKQYNDAGIDVIGVAVWDDIEATDKAVKELGIPYPVITMPKEASRAVTDAYGIMGIPCILMIDPAGKIVARDLRGDAVKAEVEKAIMAKRR